MEEEILLRDLISAKAGLKDARGFKCENEVQVIDVNSSIAHFSLRIKYLLKMLKELKGRD